MFCLHCNQETDNPKFCNNSCAAKFNNGLRKPRTDESKQKTVDSLKALHLYTKIKQCKECEKFFSYKTVPSRSPKLCKKCSKEHKSSLMKNLAIEKGFGGHTAKKKIYFKKRDGQEVYLQSSYEIRFAEILEELGVDWCRPTSFNWIDVTGTKHRYYPDFKVGNIYIDTKNNYLAIKDAEKIKRVKEQNNIDLRVVLDEQITKDYIASVV